MSRMTSREPLEIKPQSNVYTVLVIAAFVVQTVALVVMIMRHKALFGTDLWS